MSMNQQDAVFAAGTFSQLSAAITAIDAGSGVSNAVITYTGNITQTANLPILSPVAGSTVTINGNSFTLVGANAYSGLVIQSGTLTLGSPGVLGSGNITFATGDFNTLDFTTAAAPTGNKILGFVSKDELDVTDMSAAQLSFAIGGQSDVLTVIGGNNQVFTLNFDPATLGLGAETFAATPDGNGGTLIYLAPQVTIALADDTGISATDGVTSNPIVVGTADPAATVSVSDGRTFLGTATADSAGNWLFVPQNLSQGPHTLVAAVTNSDNVTGTATLALTLDTITQPSLTTPPVLSAASDSGFFNNDGITNVQTPVITGTGVPGEFVTLYDNPGDGSPVAIGTESVDTSGTWSIITSTLAAGVHIITARQGDLAGNLSAAASPALTITIDLTTPVAPAINALTPVTINALTTNDLTPTIIGNGAAGDLVEVNNVTGDTLVPAGSATVRNDGTWAVTIDSALPDGTYAFAATQTELAGNVSDPSDSFALTIADGVFRVATGAQLFPAIATIQSYTGTGGYVIDVINTPDAAGVATVDFSSADLGRALGTGATLSFAGGIERLGLTDGTLSVATNTIEATIQRLYEGLLQHSADEGALQFFDQQVANGASKTDIAGQLLSSPEYLRDTGSLSDIQFVSSLFQNALGWTIGAGPSFWTSLLSDGVSRAAVAVGIVDSPDAQTHLADATSQLFVPSAAGTLAVELYETGLGRDADAAGLSSFTSAYRNLSPLQLANGLASSTEFQADHGGQSNAAFVNSLFVDGLGRAADPGAVFWSNLLDTGAASRGAVLLGIATSTEASNNLTHTFPA